MRGCVPLHLQFYGLAGEVERQRRAHREFFSALQCPLRKGLQDAGVVEELAREFGIYENPAPAVETVSVVIDLEDGRRQLAAIFDAPGERVETRVDGAGGTAAVVEIHRAQPDYGTEGSLPLEGGKLQSELGIRLELQSPGAGSVLILVDHEGTDEADTVVTKMPAFGIADRRRE